MKIGKGTRTSEEDLLPVRGRANGFEREGDNEEPGKGRGDSGREEREVVREDLPLVKKEAVNSIED